MSCAECRRGQAADRNFCTSLSHPHRVSTTGNPEAEPSQGKQREHTHAHTHQPWRQHKNFPLALRIPEYLLLSKAALRAVEPKTKLRTGCSRVGFSELLYQPFSHSATLHAYIHSFIFIPFKHLHYSRLCCTKNTAFEIHSSDKQISLKMLAVMKNTTCKLCPTSYPISHLYMFQLLKHHYKSNTSVRIKFVSLNISSGRQ